ncbi:putative bifunctional diguanylate cyclase/phosphodiesterase [Acetanaerobacterium elongatum]|nr:bifunctional diguanylate cyclase/phosphodiesterase [Acetanaerobacterium elongatum]
MLWGFIALYLLISAATVWLLKPGHEFGLLRRAEFGSVTISGILSQVQVLVLIMLSLSKSFKTAIVLNVIGMMIVLQAILLDQSYYAAPNLIIQAGAACIVLLLSVYRKKLEKKLAAVEAQKEKLEVLYREVAAAGKLLSRRNMELQECNRIMESNEKQLNFLAMYDSLTGLPNRRMIINRLEQLIDESQHKENSFAVVFIDLDDFKKINDSLGHHTGDLFLQQVAVRFNAGIHPGDFLGRLGGDEFSLIIPRSLSQQELLNYVNSLRIALLERFVLDQKEIVITASFGIAVYPKDGDSAAELLRAADMTMYKVKESGKNEVLFFNTEMQQSLMERIRIENCLREAIENNELSLVFQPQYDAHSHGLRGFETLLRWNSAELGAVSPAKFIPIAEETGIIVNLGEWVLQKAMERFRDVHRTCAVKPILSVNISVVQFMEPSFVPMIQRILEQTGFDARYLEVEVTESVCICSMEQVLTALHQLKAMGIRIALDDFGTGYASLSYLQKLPIDTLKIDKVFIDSIIQERESHLMVGSIISLAHHLGIDVVAEGVETNKQLDYLQSRGCNYIQGFLWGKPLAGSQLEELLSKQPERVAG